jgi:hypothetical protein
MQSNKGKPTETGNKGSGNRIQDNKIWQGTVGSTKNALTGYFAFLQKYFLDQPRAEQEQLITRYCQILTIGAAVVILSFLNTFLPTIIRVFALPAILVGAWYAGTNIVPPIVIKRMEKYLNPM